MKKTMLKKLMCAVLTAVCVVTTAVPTLADDSVVTVEAATKSVTPAYKYHLEGYNNKRKHVYFSKTSFYKDLNSLPSIKTGKTTIHVPAASNGAKSVSAQKSRPVYETFVKFKAPKTGKYVVTLTNLQGTDDKSVRAMIYYGFYKPAKFGKKYGLEYMDLDTVCNYERLFENNFLEKFQNMVDAYKVEHPEYDDILDGDYAYEQNFVTTRSTDKIKFTVKLKKGQTYVYVIDNAGLRTLSDPYHDEFGSSHQTCICGGNYMEAYSFDMDIQFKK